MPLADIRVPSEEMEYGDGRIRLRALSLVEVAALANDHAPAVVRVMNGCLPHLGKGEDGDAIAVAVIGLIADCGYLVANMIAMSADEPEAAEVAFNLPFGVQITAAMTVLRLTLGNLSSDQIKREFDRAVAVALAEANGAPSEMRH